jgi:ABC-type spermidine/putrescine transport system permease subunit II
MDYSFNGHMLFGGLIALNLIFGGIVLGCMLYNAFNDLNLSRQSKRGTDLIPIIILVGAGSFIALPAVCLLVWGTFYSKIPWQMSEFSTLGGWLFYNSLRFSGYLVLFGGLCYLPLAKRKGWTEV